MACLISISKNELKDLYKEQKLTTYEIADTYNCCQATVWKRLKNCHIKRLPNGRRSFVIPKSKLRNLYINQRLSSRKIAKIYQCAYSTIDSKIKKYGFPTRNRAKAHIIYPRKNFHGTKTDKAYLIGFAMGDLRVRKICPYSETIHVDCSSTKKEQIDLISKLFIPYGRVWISEPNKKGATQVECSLNESFSFLLRKRILADNWISNNKRYFWAFIAGFTDAEGCISISGRGLAYYGLGNYNKKLLSQIRKFLIQNKISCPKLVESKIKEKLCSGKYYHNQNYWQLRVNKKTCLLLLFNFIDPHLKHFAKIKSIKRARQNIETRNKKFGNLRMN